MRQASTLRGIEWKLARCRKLTSLALPSVLLPEGRLGRESGWDVGQSSGCELAIHLAEASVVIDTRRGDVAGRQKLLVRRAGHYRLEHQNSAGAN